MSKDVDKILQEDTGIKPQIVKPNTIAMPTPEQKWIQKATKAGKIIVECLQNGLTESDGCTLAGISLTDYETLKERAPGFARLIEQTKIQFKLDLMKPITEAIKSGDVSKAQWIAERRFPGEFGQASKRVVTPPDEDNNPIADIIKKIQSGNLDKHGDITGPSINKEILKL